MTVVPGTVCGLTAIGRGILGRRSGPGRDLHAGRPHRRRHDVSRLGVLVVVSHEVIVLP
jgi:hypothetical protein